MIDQVFSWGTLLSIIGVIGFHYAGKKKWWAWYINLACQALWFTFAIATEQYGFLIGAIFFTFVFGKNAIEWTRDHRNQPPPMFHNPKFDVRLLFNNRQFIESATISQAALDVLEFEKIQSGDVKSLKHLGADLENRAFERGVRWAMSQLQSDYPYGDMPDWRQSGVDWIAERLAEWKLEHPDEGR